jgi:glycosyltransferase involved in cell wall biosynthesis
LIKTLALTGGQNTPSAKFRIRQYIKPVLEYNIQIDESYTELGSFYSKNLNINKTSFVVNNLIKRFEILYKQYNYDLIILQRELISTLYTYELFLNNPIVFDVDDAIYLNNRGIYYAKKISKKADLILCGNNYLANFYSKYSKNIEVIPTPVDTNKYIINKKNKNSKFVIGWIGTSSNFYQLELIELPLKYLLNIHNDIYFVVISDKEFQFKNFQSNRILNKNWNSETDVEDINTFDIGVMPLVDNDWSKGKCSYKLLQYMSCGIPVIASDVGMNKEVLKNTNSGYLAKNQQDWIDYIEFFYVNRSNLLHLGLEAREIVKNNYSLEHCVKNFHSVITKVI